MKTSLLYSQNTLNQPPCRDTPRQAPPPNTRAALTAKPPFSPPRRPPTSPPAFTATSTIGTVALAVALAITTQFLLVTMSLVNLSHICSHLQNCTKARLGTTSVPLTKLTLSIMLGLQDEGFLSSVTRGGPHGPDPEFTPTTQENVASRRLWLGLKYYDNEPVLRHMRMVSKPRQRIWMESSGLEELARGRRWEYVEGLQPGEVMFVQTDRGVFELREAVERRTGGQLLCRAI